MTALIEGLQLVADAPPPTAEDVPTCAVCGVELEYAGKGRKPTKCDEHRRARARGGAKVKATSTSAPGGNEKLAGQAADVLYQLNEMCGLGLMLAKLFGTASALSDRNEAFRDQAYQALLTDPGLCRTIISAGAKSGKFSLIAAYGMLVASIAPVAIEELRELRELRAEKAARLAAEADAA